MVVGLSVRERMKDREIERFFMIYIKIERETYKDKRAKEVRDIEKKREIKRDREITRGKEE